MAQYVSNMIEIIERYVNNNSDVAVLADHHINLIRSFLHKASSFRDFIIHSPFRLGVDYDLDVDEVVIRMVDASQKAENAVELQIIRNYDHKQHTLDDDDGLMMMIGDELDAVADEFQSIKQLILDRGEEDLPTYLWPVDNSPPNSDPTAMRKKKKKRRTVDDFINIYQDDLQTLKSRLLHPTRDLQIIPIFGKYLGMGKRTLALRLYNDSCISDPFHLRACVGALNEHDVKVVMLNLLESLGHLITKDIRRLPVDELGILLTTFLRYRKFFIVFHNIWDDEVWSTLRRFLPDDRVGSRIICTAWGDIHDDVAAAKFYGGEPHMMRCMRESECWLFFCQLVFGQDHCPLNHLEPIGKLILGYCKGIAQTISLIAGLLSTSEITSTFWELLAQTLKSQLEDEEGHENILGIVLLLVYNHLPYYLKPCLLYMITFRECCDIKASNIINLWIAEGFVRKFAEQKLEDIAEAYLDILIDKGLLHLRRQDPSSRVKSFEIQPVLRALYMILGKEEKFVLTKDFWSPGDENNYYFFGNNILRVSGSQLLQPHDEYELSPLARSFLSTGYASPMLEHVFVGLRLLRVLAIFQLELYQFPAQLWHMFLLRYLAFSCHSNTPTSISKLRNLQTLIIRRLPWFRAFSLPMDLLEMPQLTHVKCKETFVWRDPGNQKKFLHDKLETLSTLQLFGLSTTFFEQIPNIRKLGLYCNIAMHDVLDLACLYKLERLKCSTDWSLASKNFLSYIKFPSMIRKLTFTKCRIPPEFMKVVGALASLEELKLQKSDFLDMQSGPTEPEWELAEGEFPRLISLVMKDLNLVHWRAHANHFPRLQQLIILNCYAMLGLPEDIGDIPTLELLHVNKHSPSVVDSAMKIKDKHCGNPFLQVQITKT